MVIHDVEDSASVILETSEGPVFNYFISDGVPSPWSYEFNVHENPVYYHYEDNCYYFFGTKGSIAFPSMVIYTYNEEKYGWKEELIKETIDIENNDPMTEELIHFGRLVKGEVEPLVSGEDALETLKVINTVKNSANMGRKLYINEKMAQT